MSSAGWVMTWSLVGVGVCYFVTGLALKPAALAGRLILMAVGVATVLVALNPEQAGHGGSRTGCGPRWRSAPPR